MGAGVDFFAIQYILDSVNDGIVVIDEACLVTCFNPAAERIMGLPASKVIGLPVTDSIPNSRLPHVLKTGVPEVNQTQKTGGVSIITNRMPILDGQGKTVGAAAVFRDVTEVRELGDRLANLKKMSSLLEAILYSTDDAISVVDETGRQIMINPAYSRITGLSEKDVLGKPCTVDIAEGESMHLQVLKTRRPVRGVSMKVGPNRKAVVVNVAPILIDGELKGSVGIIHDISEIRKLTEELERVKQLIRRMAAKYSFEDIIGQSEGIKAAVSQARHVADTPVTVLLRGESGTGKEVFAHAIHNASSRHSGPFVRVNCAAIAESLLESELFGYEEGAFTGAIKGGRKGYFEEADKGTIFLDEIGDVNMGVQAKLLRVLQEKELVRVGGTKPVSIDVRVIAATNANLEQRINEGRFREDLYYRLNVVPVFIPPLRGRREDITLLTEHFRKKLSQEYGRPVADIHPEVITMLQNYDWPGNVRELENVIGRTIINMNYNEEAMLPGHVPPLDRSGRSSVSRSAGGWAGHPEETAGTLEEILAAAEKRALQWALQQTGGNKTAAARLLGVATRSLYYKLARHGLNLR